MTKTQIIEDFRERHNKEFDLSQYLADFEAGIKLEEIAQAHNVGYSPLRYLNYQLGLKGRDRLDSVIRLRKDLANESGKDYDMVHKVEEDNEKLAKKNRDLVRSLTHVRDENNNLRRMMREEDRLGLFSETFEEDLLGKLSEYTFDKLPEIEYSYNTIEESREGLCVIFSDEHAGDVVKNEEVPKNEFNYEILERRIMKVVQETISYPYQSKTLTVFNLLDSCKGIIHGGVYDSEDGFTTSLLKMTDIYVKVYTLLAQKYENINAIVTLSNHGRVTEAVASKKKWDNYDVLIIKMVDKILRAKGIVINFKFTKHDYNYTEINGAGILAFHGDSQRKFAPYKEGEVSKIQDVCLHIFGKPFKHSVNGHFHKSMICDNQYGGKSIANSTVVGDSSYGLNNGFSSITPSQTIFFVNQDGDINDYKVVNLSKII